MAIINPAVVEGARIAIRQAASTALTSTVLSLSTPAPSTSSVITPTGSNPAPTTQVSLTSAVASPTDSSTLVNGGANPGAGGNGGNNNNGGGNSSSLLFFVALGFGVVFTNLWIIVGVKYCFRYNARNRQMRSEEGEINMENVPRPHRRRREKKLMPIDEVNEKFPMLKYKTWVATRAQEGLPTQGGVSAPPSRPNSVRDASGVIPPMPSKDVMSLHDQPTTSATATATEPTAAPEDSEKVQVQIPQRAFKDYTSNTGDGFEGRSPPLQPSAARISVDSDRDADTAAAHKRFSEVSHEEDDDEHIDAALPPECLGTSGDTCAICIDTLEDDDDVRGLTCGHAFHAVCIDPWLTTRRACCPLCKADYYTPKPRPQAAEAVDGTTGVIHVTLPSDSRGNNRMNLPRQPRHAFFGFGRMTRGVRNQHVPSGRRAVGESQTRDDGHSSSLAHFRSRADSGPSSLSPGSTGLFSSFRTKLKGLRLARGRNNQDQSEPVASGANPAATDPSQLEAGTRNPQS